MPLMLFAGEQGDEIRYAAVAARRGSQERWRRTSSGSPSCATATSRSSCWSGSIPDPGGDCRNPEFTRQPSIRCSPMAIAELRISAITAATRTQPTSTRQAWRDRWDDRQRLPLLMRIDVKPVKGMPRGPRSSSNRGARRNPRAHRTTADSATLLPWGRAVSFRPQGAGKERGIALIVGPLAHDFADRGHRRAASRSACTARRLAARNALSLAQARAAADGAVERTAFELSRARATCGGRLARRRLAARRGPTARSS